MINLKDVCLLGVDSHNPNGMLASIHQSKIHAVFGDEVIEVKNTPFKGRERYSEWCIKGMYDMVKHTPCSHILITHPDSFIQNPNAWDDSWLQYDYIGAVWDGYNKYMVGNGGFCLRSKRLVKILSSLDIKGINVHPEDDFICRQIRNWLEQEYSIKFAPVEVAKQFSIEGYFLNNPRYNGEFGFHGYGVRNLPVTVNKAKEMYREHLLEQK